MYTRNRQKGANWTKKIEYNNLGTPRTHKHDLVIKHLMRPIPLEFNFQGISLSN